MELPINQIVQGDCLEVMRGLPDGCVDAIVCDPPYELGFMGKTWDSTGVAYRVDVWAEALRVLKPGGHCLAFGGTRTYHRMACAIEDAGFEIRDQMQWLYGSGFPKSLDVGKAIDKAERGVPQGGADPTSVNHGKYRTQATEGKRGEGDSGRGYGAGPGQFMQEAGSSERRVLVDAAKQWDGWGTALKPANEPICVARKPFAGTVAANVLEHGTGALNIDGCRVGTDDVIEQSGELQDMPRATVNAGYDRPNATMFRTGKPKERSGPAHAQGRWPANVILDEEAGAMLDAQSGERKSGGDNTKSIPRGGMFGNTRHTSPTQLAGSTGGASRFFYCAKASRKERNAGLGEKPCTAGPVTHRRGLDGALPCDWEKADWKRRNANHHPTVKPVKLMAYLVRLVTPPGGVVLDPFAGSGTTCVAAKTEGFDYIGIELSEEYCEIARRRVAHTEKSLFQ